MMRAAQAATLPLDPNPNPNSDLDPSPSPSPSPSPNPHHMMRAAQAALEEATAKQAQQAPSERDEL